MAAMGSHSVFIDTNLDTHMVMMVADDDTVEVFRKKLSVEHRNCFPHIGEITVHVLKVKRRGCFYHLLDSMLVKSAFGGVKNNWFLSVDVAAGQVRSGGKSLYLEAGPNTQPEVFRVTCDQPKAAESNICVNQKSEKISNINDSTPLQAESNDLMNKLVPLFPPDNVERGIGNSESPGRMLLTDKHSKPSSLGSDKKLGSEMLEDHELVRIGNEITETNTSCKKSKSKKRKKHVPCDDILEEDLQLEPIMKKPRSRENKVEIKDSCNYSKASLKDHDSLVSMSSEDTSKPHYSLKDKKKAGNAKLDGLLSPCVSSEYATKPDGSYVSAGFFDVAGATEAQTDTYKRKKKSKKTKASEGKSKVSTSEAEHVESARDAIQLPPESHGAILPDCPRTETKEGDNILSQIEGLKTSKMKTSNKVLESGNKDNLGGERENSSLLSAQTIRAQETTDNSGDATEAQVHSNKGKKKSKKAKASEAKSKVSTFEIEHAESAGDAFQLQSDSHGSLLPNCPVIETKEEDNILSQTEVLKTSKKKKKSQNTIPGSDNKDYQGGENEKASLQAIRVQETTDNNAGVTEAQDPSGKRKKKSKKSKASNEESKGLTSEVDHLENIRDAIQLQSESYEASPPDNPGTETKKGDAILSETEGLKASKLDRSSTVEGFNGNYSLEGGNGDPSTKLAQTVSVQGAKVYINDKVKTGSPASTSNTFVNSVMKQQIGDIEDPSLSTKGKKEGRAISKKLKTPQPVTPPASTFDTGVDPMMKPHIGNNEDHIISTKEKKEERARSKKIRTSKSEKGSPVNPVNQLRDILPESEVSGGKKADSLQHQQLSGNLESPQTPSNTVKYNVGGQHLVNGSTDRAHKYMEVVEDDGHEVNFRDYFVPKNDKNGTLAPTKEPVEDDVELRKHNKESKVDKKSKLRKVHSVGYSSDVEKPHDVIGDQGHKKTQTGTSNTSQLQNGKLKPHSRENALDTTEECVQTSSEGYDKIEAFPGKVSKNRTANSSGGVKSPGSPEFHSPSGVNVHASSKVNSTPSMKSGEGKTGDVLKGSQNQKSLLAASGTIFSEGSTESYEDKDDMSDASTRSPSDTSSSDHSEGESEMNRNSPGTYGQGNGILNSQITDRKNMDLDKILRSSRSYKKAKLSASQSQPEEEAENEPIQFNLDSQA